MNEPYNQFVERLTNKEQMPALSCPTITMALHAFLGFTGELSETMIAASEFDGTLALLKRKEENEEEISHTLWDRVVQERTELCKELGDIAFYAQMYVNTLNPSFNFTEMVQKSMEPEAYNKTPFSFKGIRGQIISCTGNIAETLKKIIWQDKKQLQDSLVNSVSRLAASYHVVLAESLKLINDPRFATKFPLVNPETIFNMNQEKLNLRFSSGTYSVEQAQAQKDQKPTELKEGSVKHAGTGPSPTTPRPQVTPVSQK